MSLLYDHARFFILKTVLSLGFTLSLSLSMCVFVCVSISECVLVVGVLTVFWMLKVADNRRTAKDSYKLIIYI